MELNKCMGCMENCESYPCPKCGYDPNKDPRPEYALPPETILNGRYLVGKVLGQGGFGITYIGWDLAVGRKVAVKEYYPSGQVSRSPGTAALTWYTSESANFARNSGMEIFLREAQKMAKVDAIDGVVRVLDVFPNNQTAYIVMDFVEGETLKARLKRTGPMTWDQAGEMFRSAIQAMEKVHRSGLIHRDLSPDNIMLAPNGQVKILDLGAAKDLSVNSGASSMRVAKSGFSPWEQYTQSGASGPWTDVYAMAATIYFTLTGKMPPTAMDRQEKDTLDWNLPNLLAMPSQALRTLKKAMALNVKDRTASMQELEAGLYQQTSGTARGTGKSVPVRNKKLLAIAAAAVAVVAIGGGLLLRPMLTYSAAEAMMQKEQYAKAAEAYESLGDYKDSKALAATAREEQSKADKYAAAMALLDEEKFDEAFLAFYALEDYKDSSDQASYAASRYCYQRGTELMEQEKYLLAARAFSNSDYDDSRDQKVTALANYWASQMCRVAAGYRFSVGVSNSGSISKAGKNDYGQCDLTGGSSILSLSAGVDFTVALRDDYTVSAWGRNSFHQCDVSDWDGIIMVSAGFSHTLGLRVDGTVVATGYDGNSEVSGVADWDNIVAIAAGNGISVGLKLDGTVVTAGKVDPSWGVNEWEDIVAIGACNYAGGGNTILGVHSDGTVVAVGEKAAVCNVGDWTDVVAVGAGYDYSVGLRSDGTLVTAGSLLGDGWEKMTGISDISVGDFHLLGLRDDGTVLCAGYNGEGQCDIRNW